jgi:hypothetical protein
MDRNPVLGALAMAALVAGCASNQAPKKPGPTAIVQTAPARPEASVESKADESWDDEDKPAKARPGHKTRARAIPVRPLNVKADCAFHDPSGYRGAMKLHVAQAKVQRFVASVDIPPHGSCRFDLKDFRQTDQMPNPVLRAERSGCEVHLWEQGSRVTVAFARCRDMCTSLAAFERLWPILANAGNGSCG